MSATVYDPYAFFSLPLWEELSPSIRCKIPRLLSYVYRFGHHGVLAWRPLLLRKTLNLGPKSYALLWDWMDRHHMGIQEEEYIDVSGLIAAANVTITTEIPEPQEANGSPRKHYPSDGRKRGAKQNDGVQNDSAETPHYTNGGVSAESKSPVAESESTPQPASDGVQNDSAETPQAPYVGAHTGTGGSDRINLSDSIRLIDSESNQSNPSDRSDQGVQGAKAQNGAPEPVPLTPEQERFAVQLRGDVERWTAEEIAEALRRMVKRMKTAKVDSPLPYLRSTLARMRVQDLEQAAMVLLGVESGGQPPTEKPSSVGEVLNKSSGVCANPPPMAELRQKLGGSP